MAYPDNVIHGPRIEQLPPPTMPRFKWVVTLPKESKRGGVVSTAVPVLNVPTTVVDGCLLGSTVATSYRVTAARGASGVRSTTDIPPPDSTSARVGTGGPRWARKTNVAAEAGLGTSIRTWVLRGAASARTGDKKASSGPTHEHAWAVPS